MEYQLNQSVWRRGWNDTRKVLTSWQFYIFNLLVAGVIGGFLGWYWGLATILFGMLFVWLGTIAAAPVKQRNEAREAVTHLLYSMQPSKQVQSLLEFYEEATKLMTKNITSDKESDIFSKEVEDWWKHCREWVRENISVANGVLFSRVVANPTMKFNSAYNEKHNKGLEFLYYSSKQIEQLVSRLQQTSKTQ